MSESVSKAAEARRESDWEKNRKPESPNSGKTQNPNTNCGRGEQRRTSVAEGQPNLGSNRNNPDRVVGNREKVGNIVVEAHGVNPDTTPDQTERNHSDVDSDSKAGGHKPREVKESSAAERHVQGETGFVERDRRSTQVRKNRAETEKVFDSRRKKSSSV